MESAIYEGSLTHVRRTAPARAFRYPIYMLYLDLDELTTLGRALRPVLGVEGAGLCCFRRGDYRGDPGRPLKDVVLDDVERALGARPDGAVRLLTHVRTLGRAFNPVSFYYCFANGGELRAVVAEITNTPWGERHAYVVPATDGAVSATFAKAFHVSPFLPMDQSYEWSIPIPGQHLLVEMVNTRSGEEVFRARLALVARPLTRLGLLRRLVTAPFMSLRVLAAIYAQAFRLWLARAPLYPHPKTRLPATARTDA
jgi:DUF1365 family protein